MKDVAKLLVLVVSIRLVDIVIPVCWRLGDMNDVLLSRSRSIEDAFNVNALAG